MSGEGEYCELYRTQKHRARKDHRCQACRRRIRSGDNYTKTTIIQGGEVERFKRCGACEATFNHLQELCWDHDSMWAACPALNCGMKYEDEWGDVPAEIARLPFLTDDEASLLLDGVPKVPRDA